MNHERLKFNVFHVFIRVIRLIRGSQFQIAIFTTEGTKFTEIVMRFAVLQSSRHSQSDECQKLRFVGCVTRRVTSTLSNGIGFKRAQRTSWVLTKNEAL